LTVLDIVILTVIAACAIYGARQGLIRELSHIIAFALGLFLAVKLHSTAARMLLYRLPSGTAALAAFLGLLLLVIGVVYLAFSYFKSATDKLKLGPADHVAGAAFGSIQGALVCAVIIFALANFSGALPSSYLQRSRVASFLLDRSARISGLVPGDYISKVISLFSKSAKTAVSPGQQSHVNPEAPLQIPEPQLRPSPGQLLPGFTPARNK
jgi:uncharacterized membrane protein required for colicin V production